MFLLHVLLNLLHKSGPTMSCENETFLFPQLWVRHFTQMPNCIQYFFPMYTWNLEGRIIQTNTLHDQSVPQNVHVKLSVPVLHNLNLKLFPAQAYITHITPTSTTPSPHISYNTYQGTAFNNRTTEHSLLAIYSMLRIKSLLATHWWKQWNGPPHSYT